MSTTTQSQGLRPRGDSGNLFRQIEAGFHQALTDERALDVYDIARQHEPALADIALNDLPSRLRSGGSEPYERDLIWPAVLRCYRTGPKPVWTPVLLELVAPHLAAAVAALRARASSVSTEDSVQQLIVEVLEAAQTMEMPTPARWIPNRLVLSGLRRTRRWLRRLDEVERRRAVRRSDEGVTDDEDWRLLVDLRSSDIEERDVRLIYRTRVLGETIAAIARALGVSSASLRSRRYRAEQRLREHLSEIGGRAADSRRTDGGHPAAIVPTLARGDWGGREGRDRDAAA